MSLELIAMLGGGVSGFVMKMIAAQAEAQSRNFEMMIQKQVAADQSADQASERGGVWVRRVFVGFILFAVILAPFILSLTSTTVTVEKEGLGGFFKLIGLGAGGWESLEGFVLLPEVRQAMLAIVGFYFGSSQVK
tara:strand:+ start:1220 stop:1624 length:405 start_codon:yes stop_codon:yes gene_type:complete